MTRQPLLASINERADLKTRHPDSLPWADALLPTEDRFLAEVCGCREDHSHKAKAYVAKELAQLADIERHVSIVLGLICASLGSSTSLNDPELVDALMHFAAEEYQHSNMFYRYAGMMAGKPLDAAYKTIDARVDLFRGPESLGSKLVAIIGSAYPGETVITAFEHRLRMLDPGRRHFLTKLLEAHGLDEARHVEFDHYVFDCILPGLSDDEFLDARRLYNGTMEFNHQLSLLYAALVEDALHVDFLGDNLAAAFQTTLTQILAKETLSSRTFRRADDSLNPGERSKLGQFSGQLHVHPRRDLACNRSTLSGQR